MGLGLGFGLDELGEHRGGEGGRVDAVPVSGLGRGSAALGGLAGGFKKGLGPLPRRSGKLT